MTVVATSTPAPQPSLSEATPSNLLPPSTPAGAPSSSSGAEKGRLSFSSAKSTKSGRSIRSVLSGKSGKSKSIKSPKSAVTALSDESEEASPGRPEGGRNGNGHSAGEPSAAQATQATPSPKPSKKSTMDELKTALEEFGLDTKGKKDTLFKRLLHAFRRAQTVSTPIPSNSTFDPTADPTRSVFDTAGPSRVNPYLNHDLSLDPRGLSAKAWGKQPCRAFLCFDVEATCRGGKEFSWPNEIIEFPVVLVKWDEEEGDLVDEVDAVVGPVQASIQPAPADGLDVNGHNAQAGPSRISSSQTGESDTAPTAEKRRLKIVDTFHSYVRPVWTTELSEFCVKFTGITQEVVNAAPTFPEVLRQLEDWLDKHELRDGEGLNQAMWVTDGPWDLRDFIPKQLHITPTTPSYPLYLRQPYLNIKQAFQTVLSEEYRRKGYAADHPGVAPNARALSRITTGKLVGKDGQERLKGLGFYSTITGMLEKLELGAFEGRQHCGLDDATNVARILMALAEKDVLFEPNAKLPPPNGRKKWPWMGAPGEVNWEEWMSDARTKPLATTVAPEITGAAIPTQPERAPAVDDTKLDTALADTKSAPTEISAQRESALDTAEPDAGSNAPKEMPTAAMIPLDDMKVMEEQAGPLAKPPPEEMEVLAKQVEKVAVA